MIFFALSAAFVLFFSFLAGALTKYFFNIDNKYFSFSTPIGFLILLGILQIGYSIITFKSLDPKFFTYYLYFVLGLIIVLSIVFYKAILGAIKKLNLTKVIIALGFTALLLFIYSYAEINYRMDDLNFYGKYIVNRINEVGTSDAIYSFQSYFVLLSFLIKNSDILAKIGIYTDFFDIAQVIWIPAIITAWMLVFSTVDLIDYVKERWTKTSKWIPVFVWIFVCFIIFSQYWNISVLHASGTLRRIAIPFILIMINTYVIEEQKLSKLIPVSLIFGGYLAISSSAFFISIFILYGYFIFSLLKKRHNYLNELAILALFPLSYAYIYDFVYLGTTILRYAVIGFYIAIIVLNICKLNHWVETVLNKCRYVFIVGIPVALIAFSTIVNWPYNFSVGDRTFFTNINHFDMVPDLLKFNLNDFTLLLNGLFWGLAFYGVFIGLKKKVNSWYYVLFGVTVITFFNPFVYDFMVNVVTSVAYFRITDIIFNSVILIELLLFILDNKKLRPVWAGMIIVLIMLKGSTLSFDYLNFGPDYNSIYHTSNKEIAVMDKLSNDYLKHEEKKSFNIASQIYGAQFFTHFDVTNLLEDRFSYIVMGDSEFERIFYRRIPGFEDVEVDYTHACSLAFEKNTDYVILDAQYNWQLQEGLWSCSELLFEEDTYRVLKMNMEYWQSNIKQGYVEEYDLNQTVQ